MNTKESITSLIDKLSNGGRVEYSSGPSHPVSPNPELRAKLDTILLRLPFLRHDDGYLTFLELFWQISIWNQETNTVVNIYPCDEVDTDCADAPLDGDYPFATATRYYRSSEASATSFVVNTFFIAQGASSPVDIVAVRSTPNALPSGEITICQDFLSWMNAIAENGGLLLERSPL